MRALWQIEYSVGSNKRSPEGGWRDGGGERAYLVHEWEDTLDFLKMESSYYNFFFINKCCFYCQEYFFYFMIEMLNTTGLWKIILLLLFFNQHILYMDDSQATLQNKRTFN